MHITSCTGHMRRSSIVIFCPTIPPPVTASELMTVVECSDKIPHSETIAIHQGKCFPAHQLRIQLGAAHTLPADSAETERQQIRGITEQERANRLYKRLKFRRNAGSPALRRRRASPDRCCDSQKGRAAAKRRGRDDDEQHIGNAAPQVIAPAFGRIGRGHNEW